MVNQTKLADEVVKVLVAGVDVSFCTHADDAVKMVDVDMHKDPEEACEDLCADLLEILGERNTYNIEEKAVSDSQLNMNLIGRTQLSSWPTSSI